MDDLGFATRRQLQVIAEISGGERNALRVLREMEADRLIASHRRECKVFYVARKGKERIGATTDVKSTGYIDHTLMRNDLYIALGMPEDWRVEVPVNYGEGTVNCDALYTHANEFHFVEIDNAQTMRNNYDKLQRYAILSKGFFHQYKHTPTVVFYTVTALRKRKLLEHAQQVGVKLIVYVKGDAP